MCQRYSRFTEATKLREAPKDEKKRPAGWLVQRVEEAYDALAIELSKCDKDRRMGRVPDVVAAALWRKSVPKLV